MTDAIASYVQKLRVAENATDEEIKTALHQLFSYGPQGPSSRQDQLAPQGQSVLNTLKVQIQLKTQALKASQRMPQFFRPQRSPRSSWTQL